jgi:protein gp37
MTGIQWTDQTWNPVRGCSRFSEGCRHCYAEDWAARLSGPRQAYEGFAEMTPSGPRWTGEVRLMRERLDLPLHWPNPRLIFVNSMSDLFHEALPEEDIRQIFNVMVRAHWHMFQVLTKRAERLPALASCLRWPPNLWQGVSVESADYLWRIDCLRRVPAIVHFLSIEPLLGPIPDLPLDGIDWIIVGGESHGPPDRALVTRDPDGTWTPKQEAVEWVRSIRDQCDKANVPFFFKQWGGPRPKSGGASLDGRQWHQFPA